MKEQNRKAFKANEAGIPEAVHRPGAEQAILKRDYNRMLELGGDIYFTAKLARGTGIRSATSPR